MIFINDEIKKSAKEHGVNLWEVAERFGVTDSTFSVWLRKEFTPEKKEFALKIIEELARERGVM